MKREIALKVNYFIFLTACFVGCSTVNTTLLNNVGETKISPTPQNSLSTNQNGIIKEEGWQIPLPVKKKRTKSIVITKTSEVGIYVEVTCTYYVPDSKFVYSEDPFSDGNQNTVLIKGELELVNFIEYRVKDKIFSYNIFARKNRDGKQADDNSTHNHVFVYRILDRDGDGKFETLLSDGSELVVPKWASISERGM